MNFHISILFTSALFTGMITGQEAMSLKFFASDLDFISGNTMSASARHKTKHIEVAYDEIGNPLLKSSINEHGIISSQEMYSYRQDGSLQKKATLNENQKVIELVRYGNEESWSNEFRKYSTPAQSAFQAIAQESIFKVGLADQIHSIEFRAIDQTFYGRIDFRYDHLGFLSEEIWRSIPNNSIIRRFAYHYNLMTEKNQIWEYGKDGSLVSHMVLEQAPADQLYKTAFPRTGNTLDEVDLIIEDLLRTKQQSNTVAFIPKMDWDRIRLSTGEDYMADVVNVLGEEVLFRLPEDLSLYRLPLNRVQSVMSRNGDLLYP
ncbi:MAG: hypothetical protein HOD97_01665 [Candidatus Marinimicrobia bacterium]|jgi:hypothetical protein|nr:hypothetical protein [Candidatus Neomarinimicrobiota bacterium]MBT3617993.1 hypothetical protein [Candidatus Neomarinimicrobiota bacterium]MBT3828550.1 hypothetical protein [Candidatus Neomarinimicrobiota bacterium]MBT3997979.1 hypothetical protein [Candidatus Neomarinimicrobiota bacterium]MBT4280317.1 hypothetical protein [Candidatus Neomarinimicrobiota bacterium]